MTSHQDLRPIVISIGGKRTAKEWPSKKTTWAQLANVLASPKQTGETFEQYAGFSKDRQGAIKDIGGFVGGKLQGNKRRSDAVEYRSILTLDIDEAKLEAWERFKVVYGYAACVYSTHSHSAESPRLRLVMPLDRDASAVEYEALARRVAEWFGIDQMDTSTYQASRLMYWPSTASDGEFYHDVSEGTWLSVDAVLATYTNWADAREYPVSSKEKQLVRKLVNAKASDPRQRPLGSTVGVFCRLYSVPEAIEKFLGDVYEPCEGISGDVRYTYAHGSTSGGLVIYGPERGDHGDIFACSHHGTDPVMMCGSGCVNAFDLVRIHLYGDLDRDNKPDTPPHRAKSFLEMEKWLLEDADYKLALLREKKQKDKAAVHSDFGGGPDDEDDEGGYEDNEDIDGLLSEGEGDDWMVQLETDHKGNVRSTIGNAVLMMENDPKLKGLFGYNEFTHRIVVTRLPFWERGARAGGWKPRDIDDSDEASLREYLEVQGIGVKEHVVTALRIVYKRWAFHPIRSYLGSLVWDGRERVDTLFVDYLGCEDTEYVRAVTRKALCACVARVMEPGIKFDTALVLVGAQGRGKSTILTKLAKSGGRAGSGEDRSWFSDSFSFEMVGKKESVEQLGGKWIMEVGEVVGMDKAKEEEIKRFLSSQADNMRIPWDKYTKEMPRQCVFFGTTNKFDFLRGNDGNRRFWPLPIDVAAGGRARDLWKELSGGEVDQIWAECLVRWSVWGEELMLSEGLEAVAVGMQQAHSETSVMLDDVANYVDVRIPAGWYNGWSLMARVEYFNTRAGAVEDDLRERGVELRERVSFKEVWLEGLQMGQKLPTNRDREVVRGCLKKLGWIEMEVGRPHRVDQGCYKLQRCVFERPVNSLLL